jgi:glucose-1-phosphate thymidylyltransferase
MKGIILAGGKATRLYPVTRSVCKQLLPVYDKPMIYYPLSTLMLAGLKDILIISTARDLPKFKELLGDGSSLGIRLSYAKQDKPGGIAESFIVGENFIGKDRVCLILGDNIFYGNELVKLLKEARQLKSGGMVFGYYVNDPQRYGVIGFDRKQKVSSITEKPKKPASNWVVTGIYFFDNQVIRIAKSLKRSSRGELEITGVNDAYLKKRKLKVKLLGRGFAWLDTGTYDSLINASVFIKTVEERQGLKIGCIEEVAYNMGYINAKQLGRLAKTIPTAYGTYLKQVIKHG